MREADTLHPFNEISTLLRTFLDHMMELVCAVYLACAQMVTPDRAYTYHSYIAHYITNLTKVHLTFTLHLNHHAAFPIYNYLLLFSPAHSWWCFHFECWIGILQHLPVNHKSGGLLWNISWSGIDSFFARWVGSYNATFLTAELHYWLSQLDCPPAIQECKVLFDRIYAPKSIQVLTKNLLKILWMTVYRFSPYLKTYAHLLNNGRHLMKQIQLKVM